MPDRLTHTPTLAANLSFDDTAIAFKQQNNSELKRSYWLFKLISNNFLVNIGPFFTKIALAMKLPISGMIKATVFSQFCGGETIEECTPKIQKLSEAGVGTILDYSVEGEEKEAAFDDTANEIIHTLKKAVEMPQAIPFCVFKLSGVARFALLEKVNEKKKLKDYEQFEWNKAMARVERICETAFEFDKPLMIDAEESWVQNTVDDIALQMMRRFNKERAIIFNTYQLYRNDKLNSLITDCTFAKTDDFYLGAKLVRGAYMEKERKRAAEKSIPSVIQVDKESTDRDYDLAITFCLENLDRISFVVGTHNQESCRKAIEQMEQQNTPPHDHHVYFSQLLGMSDHLSFNLSNAGYNVAKYVPYGPVKNVLPYLFRRAEENMAIAGQMGRELRLISAEMKRRKLKRFRTF